MQGALARVRLKLEVSVRRFVRVFVDLLCDVHFSVGTHRSGAQGDPVHIVFCRKAPTIFASRNGLCGILSFVVTSYLLRFT